MYVRFIIDGKEVEFWGVRSWTAYEEENTLWVYFNNPVFPDGTACGYVEFESLLVLRSFLYGDQNEPENIFLEILR